MQMAIDIVSNVCLAWGVVFATIGVVAFINELLCIEE